MMTNLVNLKKHALHPGFLVCWLVTAAMLGALLSACQPSPGPAAQGSQVVTTALPLSTPQSKPSPSLSPTQTSQPTPEATLSAEMQVRPEDLKGVQVVFWYPWSGNSANAG